MRWFKHMTATRRDEKISAYLDDAGKNSIEAYGFWWMLLEIIADQMSKDDAKCFATYSLPQWSRLLSSHHNKVIKYLSMLENSGLIHVSKESMDQLPNDYPSVTPPVTSPLLGGVTGGVTDKYRKGKLRVTVPNLLKYRDEYSKKSGQTPDNVRSKKQNTDTDTDTDKKNPAIAVVSSSNDWHPIWDGGKDSLIALGLSDKEARGFIGQMLKMYHDHSVEWACSKLSDEMAKTTIRDAKSYFHGLLKRECQRKDQVAL